MAQEEKKRVEEGTSTSHEVSASAFLLLGMNIQVSQYDSHFLTFRLILLLMPAFYYRQALRLEVRGMRKQTILQTASLVERRTTLLKHVQRFREIQRLHMPEFDPNTHIHTTLSPSLASTNVEDSILWLPSELSAHDRRRYCGAVLSKMDDRLWFAEAMDTLESLRHHLRTRSFTNRFKIANVTGQVHNT
jgi:hypothetical protein